MWSYAIHSTLTGAHRFDVFPSVGTWRRTFSAVGSGSHEFQLRADFDDDMSDAEWAAHRAWWKAETQEWGRTLVVKWNGVPLYAGLIVFRKYSKTTGVLTLEHQEIRAIFTRRHLYGVDEFDPNSVDAPQNKSLRGLIRAVVIAATFRDLPGSLWTLPVSYPADEAGPHSKLWEHWKLLKAEDILAELKGMEGAPDVDFVPRILPDGRLRWELVIGTPRLPGALIDLPASVDQPALTNLLWEESAERQVTGTLMIGTGSGPKIRVGKAGSTVPVSIPYLDDSRTAKQADDETDLNSLAAGEQAQFQSPIEQWGFDLVATEDLDVGSLIPGARLRVSTFRDEWLDDGAHDFYLVGLAGNTGLRLTPEVQPL